ncbi:MAG TPA: hypothetical protein VHZ24_20725 [Pirellulales bacterium]|nr:hypothetical protein [Pirellulales bacterium]
MDSIRNERRLIDEPSSVPWVERFAALFPSVDAATGAVQASAGHSNPASGPPATSANEFVTSAALAAAEARFNEALVAMEARLLESTQSYLARVLLGLDASRQAALRYRRTRAISSGGDSCK